jgi:Rod binding domain-containing protein
MSVTPAGSDIGMIKANDIAGSEKCISEKDRIKAKKVAKDFEALFTGLMLKSMRETVGKDSLTNGGHGEEVYRSLLDQEYAKAISEGQGLGLAKNIEGYLLKSLPANEGKSACKGK